MTIACPKPLRPVALAAGVAALWAGSGAAAAVEVVPHRAIYELDLARSSDGGAVIDVDGQMFFEWGDACDGWTVEQRYLMRFFYAQGEEVELSSTYSTWEAKNGTEFTFNLRSETDGEVDEEIRGSASLAQLGEEGTAEFRIPEERSEILPPGTIFPTQHTLALLREAEQGRHLFVTMLFDGTELEGLTEVSAAIGDLVEASETPDRPLLDRPSWPVVMAFFPAESPEGLPEYEMAARIYDNGIAGDMVIDYGDFAVTARLTDLQRLEDAGC